jgi:hypothetical protein
MFSALRPRRHAANGCIEGRKRRQSGARVVTLAAEVLRTSRAFRNTSAAGVQGVARQMHL